MSNEPESSAENAWRALVRDAFAAEPLTASSTLRNQLQAKLAAIESTDDQPNASPLSSSRSEIMTVSLPEKEPTEPLTWKSIFRRRWPELATVAGILFVLANLMLPAVQSSRESSRRSEALNNKRLADLKSRANVEYAQSASEGKLANAPGEKSDVFYDNAQGEPAGVYGGAAPVTNKDMHGFRAVPGYIVDEIATRNKQLLEEKIADHPEPPMSQPEAPAAELQDFGTAPSTKRTMPKDIGPVPGTGLSGRSAPAPGQPSSKLNRNQQPRVTLYNGQSRYAIESEFDGGHPEPTNNSEQYDAITDNPFREVKQQPLSTFSIDLDTASYANVRRFLTEGRLPPRNAVRIEELVNYFKFSDPAPKDDAPFSANMEAAPCPWNAEHLLLRVGLKGKEVHRAERPASNLVFLVDVSGSMADQNKLPLLQASLKLMVDQLTENDRVTIVTYAGDTGVRMPPTIGLEKAKIKSVIDGLASGGSTHGSAGIVLAYDQAKAGFIKQGANRVILCTDGDLNVGITRDEELVELITQQAKSGVFLTVLGFGTGNLKDSKMEKLADHGNGMYAYIDSLKEGRKVLVEQMSGSTVTIAKDVKIQIEFNPQQIGAYRLLGYENRILAAKDFNDDKKDAGEIGAGHSVTALYELVPVGAKVATDEVDPLKYQPAKTETVKADEPKAEPAEVPAVLSKELLTLKLRYKQPDADTSKLLTFPLSEHKARFGEASADFRFASSVAAFGMMLRQSPYRGDMKLAAITEIAASSLGDDTDTNGYRTEFLDLLRRAKELGAE